MARFFVVLVFLVALGQRSEAGILIQSYWTATSNATTTHVTWELYAGADVGTQDVNNYTLDVSFNSIVGRSNVVGTAAPATSLWFANTGTGNPPFRGSPGILQTLTTVTYFGTGELANQNKSISLFAKDAAHLLGQLSFDVARQATDYSFSLTPTNVLFQQVFPIGTVSTTFNAVDGPIMIPALPLATVPEPASFLLCGAGIAFYGLRRRTRGGKRE